MGGFFVCKNCKSKVSLKALGTKNRNHCPFCLWSLHLDNIFAGDRKSSCGGLMKPIALTFKKIRPDKFGKDKKGELMIVHLCQKCGKVSINRIAGDDDPKVLWNLYESSLSKKAALENIEIANLSDRSEVERQLFGEKL